MLQEGGSRGSVGHISAIVWCYRGALVTPKWKDIDAGPYMLQEFCGIILTLL